MVDYGSVEIVDVMELFSRRVLDAEAKLVENFVRAHPDQVPMIERKWEGFTLTTTLRSRGPALRHHVIIRNGMFYKPDRSGYTSSLQEAGRYTEAEGMIEAMDVEGVTYELAGPRH